MRGGDAGWFGPGSATWRINCEAALVLGGGRALILQVAHPLVGAGVDHHSRVYVDRWGRLSHTLETMGQILFGDTATARRAAARMRKAHARIRGVVSTGEAAGRAYDATDPALVLWVWATLVDTSLVAYELYVRRLRPEQIARYYEEQKRFAYACGVPAGACPSTHDDFRVYFDTIVATTLEATNAARRVTAMALQPFDLPRLAAPVLGALALPTIGLLPERLRNDLGLTWSPTRARLLASGAYVCRLTLPLFPRRIRHVRSARAARERARADRRA
jgi:uncharacterized protein (DUF2236 family)